MQIFQNTFYVTLTAKGSFFEDIAGARESSRRLLKNMKDAGFSGEVSIVDSHGESIPLDPAPVTVRTNIQETSETLRKFSNLLEKNGINPDGVSEAFSMEKVGPHRENMTVDWAKIKTLVIDGQDVDPERFKTLVAEFLMGETLRGISLKKKN